MAPRACLWWSASIAIALLAAAAPSAIEPHKVYVAVADTRGRPVKDLTAADFRVVLDSPQEILSVRLATEPVSVVLLTDRLGLEAAYTPFDLARALRTFVKTIQSLAPGSQFALTTFDGPVVRLASFGLPHVELDRMLGRLSGITRDSALRDAVLDVSNTMRTAPTMRRVIFAVYGGYRPDMSTVRTDNAADALRVSGASLWAIEARTTGENSFGNNERELLVDRGSAYSGGMREIVASAVGIDTTARQMAELIGAQYEITYAPGGGTRNSSRKVMVSRPGLKVLAPGWISDARLRAAPVAR